MAETRSYRLIEVPRGRLARLREAVRSYLVGPISSNSHDWSAWVGSNPTSSGLTVNEYTALNISAVWRNVNRISNDISSLPLMLYRRLPKGGKERMPNHPLFRLLHDQPNPEMTSMVWRQTMQAHALTWGNGYSEIVRDQANRPIALWPLCPDRVSPYRAGPGAPLQYRVANTQGAPVFLDAGDVIHVHGLGYDGIQGYSVVGHARESMGLAQATEKFGSTMFGNGTAFGGILQHPGKLTEQARKNLKDSLAAQHQGVERAHKFVILEEGLTYAKNTIPPDDAQFLQTREFQRVEIDQWFNIPRQQIRAIIEDETIEYYTTTLMPWLALWEEELTTKLIASSELNIQVIEHNLAGKLRGNTTARGDFYQKLFGVGAITANEIRAFENLAPIDGGDIAFVPLNLTPAHLAEPYVQAQIDAKKNGGKMAPPVKDLGPTPIDAANNRIAKLEEELAIARRMTQEAEDRGAQRLAEARAEDAETIRQERDRVERFSLDLLTEQRARAKADTDNAILTQQLADQVTIVEERDGIIFDKDKCVTLATTEAEDLRQQKTALATELREKISQYEAREQEWTTRVTASEAAVLAANTEATELRAEKNALVEDLAREEAVSEALEETRRQAELQLQASHTRLEQVTAELTALRDDHAALVWRLDRSKQTIRGVLLEIVAGLLTKETDRARKAQGSPEKLAKWAESFYELHVETCRAALRPAMRAYVAAAGTSGAIEAVIAEACADSQKAIRGVIADSDPETLPMALERLLRRWEAERPEQIVDALTGGV